MKWRAFIVESVMIVIVGFATGLAGSAEGSTPEDSSAVAAARIPGLSKDDTTSWDDVELILNGALVDPNNGERGELRLYLGCRDRIWRDYVLGATTSEKPNMPHVSTRLTHEGSITEVTDDGSSVRLVLAMTIHGGPWSSGGRATYTLTLTRSRQGDSMSGAYSGTYRNKQLLGGAAKVKGNAGGKVHSPLWPRPVSGYVPLRPAEHPRLLFRQHELGALRQRLETTEGQAIIERLKKLLGGGEALPPRRGRGKRGGAVAEPGAYTLWHAMGFGFLYQVTGKKTYAELARKCVELARQGQPDRDPAYSWTQPAGRAQAGPGFAAIAMAYDMCYEAWEPAYRKALACEIQDKVFVPVAEEDALADIGEELLGEPEPVATEKAKGPSENVGLVLNLGSEPHQRFGHGYGAWNAGGGMAILAILGDPGVDADVLRRSHRIFRYRIKRALRSGYGDRGYVLNGQPKSGRLSVNTGLAGYFQAARVALGENWTADNTTVPWLVTKWLFEIMRHDGKLIMLMKDGAIDEFRRDGPDGGDFAQGFGICQEAHKPALLWFYRNVVDPGPDSTYDAVTYPHHAVYSFVNWPLGLQPKAPDRVLGHMIMDSRSSRSVFRSRWGTPHDVIMSNAGLLLHQGATNAFGRTVLGETTFVEQDDHGTVVVAMESEDLMGRWAHNTSMAVDLSGLSGTVPLVIGVEAEPRMTYPPGVPHDLMVLLSSGRPKPDVPAVLPRLETTDVRLEHCRMKLLALPGGEALDIRLVGSGRDARVQVGTRLISFDGKRIVLEKDAP